MKFAKHATGRWEVDRVNYDGGRQLPDDPLGINVPDRCPARDNNREQQLAHVDGRLAVTATKGTPGAFNYDCFDATTLDGGTVRRHWRK